MYRPTWAEIDLDAIRKNVKAIKNMLPKGTLLMAVVKADGYGHGSVQVARTALEAGADRLGVALVEEAFPIRQAGIKAPIHLLGATYKESVDEIIRLNLIPSVYTKKQAEWLSKTSIKQKKRLNVHIKIDTGMNRIGVDYKKANEFIKEVRKQKSLEIEGIFTHYATADKSGSSFAKLQTDRFNKIIKMTQIDKIKLPLIHASNSAAAILMPKTHFNMVRVGIAMYGLHPSNITKNKVRLTPALSLKSKLSYVKAVGAGEGISYGHTFETIKRTNVGTIPIGYADGYSRLLSNKSEVLIKGKRYRQVGRICMDQFMVDLKSSSVDENDQVVLIGKQGRDEISADELAKILGTINYEIVCGISKRVPRVYLNE